MSANKLPLKYYTWWAGLACKLSFTVTMLALAILPILMATGVLPVSMLGIVAFAGPGAIAASVALLVVLPLIATAVFYLLQYDKKGGWLQKPAEFLRHLIVSHKTQIAFWALGTITAAVLLTLFLPPVAIPGFTTTATLALIIVGVSLVIPLVEMVTLKGIVNVIARWFYAGAAQSYEKSSLARAFVDVCVNTSLVSALTGASKVDYDKIKSNDYECTSRTFFTPVPRPGPEEDEHGDSHGSIPGSNGSE